MAKVVLAMFMSLDGYINGPGGTFLAPRFSPDLQHHWIERNMARAGMMMYGRVAYEGMVQFWTSPTAPQEQAQALARLDKVVFSRTLQHADWGNVTIVRDDIAIEVGKRREQMSKDIVLIAGAGIATTFLELDLVDELCLLILPQLVGGGTRLFDGEAARRLQFVEALPFDTGCVRLTYMRANS